MSVRSRSAIPLSARRVGALALAFAAGIAAAAADEPRGCLLALATMLLPALWLAGTAPRPLAVPARRTLSLAAAVAAGAVAAVLQQRADPVPALFHEWTRRGFAEHRTPVRIRGVIADLERPDPDRAILLVRSLGDPGAASVRFVLPRGPGLRLSVPIEPDRPIPWAIGDRIETTVRVGRARAWRNPGGFDYAASLRTRDIDLTGAIKSPRLVEGAGHEPVGRFAGARLRRLLADRLVAAASAADRPTASFLLALLLGERQSLAPDLEERLKRAGVYHILALSGFNVALVAGGAALLLRLLLRAPPLRRAALAAVVIAYAAIARPGGSIFRAALMVLLLLAARQAARRTAPLGALAVSALLLLAARPAWLCDAGFQLSYAATLGLLLAGPDPADGTHPAGATKMARLLRVGRTAASGSLRASAAALAATAPLTARHFQTVTLAGLLGNLAAVPLAAACLGIAILAAPLALVWPPGAALLTRAATPLVDLIAASAGIAASLPGASFFIQPPSWPVVALLLLLLATASLLPPGTRRRAACLAALLVLAALAVRGRVPRPPGRLEVVALDVGQGDAVLVRFPSGGAMLVDAGGLPRGDFDPGARVVAPALRALGVLRLDRVVVTHPHRDHLGGVPAIVEQFRPGEVWIGAAAEDDRVAAVERAARTVGAAVLRPRGGIALRLGGARMEVLNPIGAAFDRTRRRAGNDDSIVLRILYGRRAVLLTGDMERPAEDRLLAEGHALKADLLKVAHHGSDTSSSLPFLEAAAPQAAIVSVGALNAWGHPSPRVLDRLRGTGARTFRTDRDGALRARTDGLSPWRLEELTSAPGDPEHLGGEREEGEQEQEQAEGGDQQASPSQRLNLVDRARVPDAEDSEQDAEEDEVIAAGEQAEDHQDRDPGPRDDHVGARRKGVEHVTAIELPDRQQVQRGGEQPEPGGDEQRMQADGHARLRAEEERVQERQQEARRQRDVPGGRGSGDDGRAQQAVQENRDEGHEPGDRPGDPHVEQCAAGGERGTDPDHRAERAEQVRTRQEVGEGGVDAIEPAGDVVPHLVTTEYEQGGKGVRQAADPRPRRPDDALEQIHRKRLGGGQDRPRQGRGQKGQEEQDQVAGRGPPGGRRRGGRNRRPGFERDRAELRVQAPLPEVSEILPGLEADRLAGGDADLGPGPRVPADPFLARLHLKNAEPAQFDPLPATHRLLHRVENRLDRHHRPDPGDLGRARHIINDVALNHAILPPGPARLARSIGGKYRTVNSLRRSSC